MQSIVDFQARVASDVILAGGVIAYPTEGVWGLGCDPWNPEAVGRLLEIKQRPVEKGLILIGHSLAQLEPWLAPLTSEQRYQLEQSWPGPNTWVVEHNGRLPEWVTGGRDNVAIRVSGHPLARALCKRSGIPIVSTSANKTGKPSITERLQVMLKLAVELDWVTPGQVQNPGQASTIRLLEGGVVLRP